MRCLNGIISSFEPRIFTEALRPEERLGDHVWDGAELTALVVPSAAGEFVCQAGAGGGCLVMVSVVG